MANSGIDHAKPVFLVRTWVGKDDGTGFYSVDLPFVAARQGYRYYAQVEVAYPDGTVLICKRRRNENAPIAQGGPSYQGISCDSLRMTPDAKVTLQDEL